MNVTKLGIEPSVPFEIVINDVEYKVLKLEHYNSLFGKIKEILKGIDQEELDSNDGFWMNSTGAEHGSKMLRKIEDLFP